MCQVSMVRNLRRYMLTVTMTPIYLSTRVRPLKGLKSGAGMTHVVRCPFLQIGDTSYRTKTNVHKEFMMLENQYVKRLNT